MCCLGQAVQLFVLHCWVMTCGTVLDYHAFSIGGLFTFIIHAMVTGFTSIVALMHSVGLYPCTAALRLYSPGTRSLITNPFSSFVVFPIYSLLSHILTPGSALFCRTDPASITWGRNKLLPVNCTTIRKRSFSSPCSLRYSFIQKPTN